MKNRIAATLAAGVLAATGLAVSAPAAYAAPAKKVGSHDLIVKNVGNVPIIVCTHWGASRGDGEYRYSCTPNGSKSLYYTLMPGDWSDRKPISEDDIDGYYVPPGCKMREEIKGPNVSLTGYHKHGAYHKISPIIYVWGIDHHRQIYLKCK